MIDLLFTAYPDMKPKRLLKPFRGRTERGRERVSSGTDFGTIGESKEEENLRAILRSLYSHALSEQVKRQLISAETGYNKHDISLLWNFFVKYVFEMEF